jgi:aminopeptidase N
VLELTETTQTFRFVDIKTAPVPSLARDFSAPVVVDYRYSDAELAFLAAFDSDGFNRWEAGQRLAVGRLLAATDAFEMQRVPQLDDTLLDVYRRLLADQTLAPAFKERALQLPAESFLAESRAIVDPEAIRSARLWIRREIGRRLAGPLRDIVLTYADAGAYSPDTVSAGRRGLRNLALGLLIDGGSADALDAAQQQLETATNMTDRHAALTAIVNSPAHFKVDALLRFARDWQHEPLVMNKWFNVQATAVAQPGEPAVLTRVKALLKHAAFSLSNPNNVYALVLGFTNNNPAEFHRADGSGYAFWLDIVLQLDQLNPTVAARTARALDRWRKFTPDRARQMRDVLIEVARAPELSRDVREIVTKALEN